MNYYGAFNTSNTTSATIGAGITYPSGIPEFILPEYPNSSFRNTWVHPSVIPEFILPKYLSLSFRNTWVYLSGIPKFILPENLSSHMIFSGVRIAQSSYLCVALCKSLFVPLFVFFFSLFICPWWLLVTNWCNNIHSFLLWT